MLGKVGCEGKSMFKTAKYVLRNFLFRTRDVTGSKFTGLPDPD